MTTPAPSSAPVLVVAHGSRNPRWVAVQRDWFDGVRRRLLGSGVEARLCFLEITEPLLEQELAALDGTAPLLRVFPFFLSKSGHVAEDIPEVVAQTVHQSRVEIIEPTGRVNVLGANAGRRLREAGADPAAPVVVSGYGSSAGDQEWLNLVDGIRRGAGEYAGARWLWAPAGHFLADYAQPLRDCLAEVSAAGHVGCAILPLYLSVSSYQEELIPRVSGEFPALRIAWRPTAILPDDDLEQWAAGLLIAAQSPQQGW